VAYKLFIPANADISDESLGQSWIGEGIEEQIDLCRFQTIEPVFRKYLSGDGRVLEAGCGLGRWVFYLKRMGYDVSGIEFSRTALDAIRAFDANAPIGFGDVLKLDYPDNHFKSLISLGVVEHFEEGPRKALRESIRVLENGGLLLITVPTLNVLRNLYVHRMWDLRQGLQRKRGRKYSFYEYRFGKREFAGILEAEGLEILETVADDFTPPKSIGLYTDFIPLQHRSRKWELNAAGRALQRLLHGISIDTYAAGTLYVCRVKKNP
jgi:SAM-dependent methyltransferase